MSKLLDDKFAGLIFKQHKTTRFNGTKQLDNLGNYGGDIGSRYIVNRNGEYNGIVIELMEKVYPIYLSNSVHQFYMCAEADFIGIEVLIERYNLANLYQKYSNELIKFIVDEFLISNNLEPIYSNYPFIKSKLSSDIKLAELKNVILFDYHELIPVPIKIVGTGSLLPEDWMGKIFSSGKDFHQSIDLLDKRIGKPPVTYLANYAMVKQTLNLPEQANIKIIDEYKKTNSNIFVLDSEKLKFNFGCTHIKPNVNYYLLQVNFDSTDIKLNNLLYNEHLLISSKVLVLFEWDKILVDETKINQINTSIGFNVSLLQKSIRKGSETINGLMEAINNLSRAKPFNNPEYSYEMVSGSRQMMWRIFITIIEETKLYKSKKYLDIIDFVLYSFIFSKYPNYFISSQLVELVLSTMRCIQSFKSYWDFRPWKSSKNKFLPPYLVEDIKIRQFQLGILMGIKLMPGMKGDKLMLESTIKWLETNPELEELEKSENIGKTTIGEQSSNTNNLIEKINWFSSLDHHSNPNLITQIHNGLYGLNQDKYSQYGIEGKENQILGLEKISGMIWNLNSAYNFRKHEFRWNKFNDLIYLIQVLMNKAKSNIIIDDKEYLKKYIARLVKNHKLHNIYNLNSILYLEAEINLKTNLIEYEKLRLDWKKDFKQILLKQEICEYKNGISPERIGQLILSHQYLNGFWFKGKKIIPIYTNTQLKFKSGDVIYNMESEANSNSLNYDKILNYFLTNYKAITKPSAKIFINKQFNIIVELNSIWINGLECVKINQPKTSDIKSSYIQLVWVENNLNKFLLNEQIILSNIDPESKVMNELKYIIQTNNTNPLNKYICYKSLIDCGIKIKQNQLINSKILNHIPLEIIKKLICRIETSIEDKNDRLILLLGKVDRMGKATTEAVDNVDEGYIIRLVNVFSCLFGCFEKINETKFIIHTNSKVYKFFLDKIQYISDKKNKKNKENKKKHKNNKDDVDNNKYLDSTEFIKTKLWKHQSDIKNSIISGIEKWGQKGWGDASNVGSGKTLTGLSVIEGIEKLSVEYNNISNYLILTPNTNLYNVWIDEIKTHCDTNKINCWIQGSSGQWNLQIFGENESKNECDMKKINLCISTMGRNRDCPIKSDIKFVIIDECLTVQNNTSKWTMKAFEQVVRSKYGVLMLSATFFRTRFDKLFFMLKMFQLQIPAKPEYLDTILNIAIGANIRINKTKWIETANKIKMDDEFYSSYSKHKKKDKKESYLELKKFMFVNVNWENLIVEKTNQLVKQERKVLVFVESEAQIEKLNILLEKSNIKDQWSFYPDISNDICVISKHKGTYGINNLVKYDTILMKPPEPDKLPQIKGRLDRPGQIKKKLYLEYLVIADTIDEIDLVSLQIANNFYSSHIMPLANYYLKYA
jgi:hypothetical protein